MPLWGFYGAIKKINSGVFLVLKFAGNFTFSIPGLGIISRKKSALFGAVAKLQVSPLSLIHGKKPLNRTL
jgi:hypothetical protein